MQLKTADSITSCVIRHSFLSVTGVYILSTPLHFASINDIGGSTLWILSTFFILCGLYEIFSAFKEDRLNKKLLVILSIIIPAVVLFLSRLYSTSKHKPVWILVGGMALIAVLYYFSDRKKHQEELNIFLITGLGTVLKFYYVLITSTNLRQHDVGKWGDTDCHKGYIEYILNNHSLPDLNPMETWQFNHPPLHHILSAAWIGINENAFGVNHDIARDSIQILTLLYSILIVLLGIKIMQHFNVTGHALYLPLIILSFHPSLIYLAGSVNNDTLAACLVLAAIYVTLKWYQDQSLKSIIILALLIGAGMMTKLSAGIIAPAIAIVFLMVLISRFKKHTGVKQIIIQYGIFGLISLPLGLWFPIKEKIEWNMPLFYVSSPKINSPQHIEESFLSRVFDFAPYQFKNVYEQFLRYKNDGPVGYNEHNPLIAAIKTSVFGEYIKNNTFDKIGSSTTNLFSFIIFWISVIIAILTAVALVYLLIRIRKMKADKDTKNMMIFVTALIVFIMAGFYNLNYKLPFVCSMDFRYITTLVPISCLILGLVLNYSVLRNKDSHKEKLIVMYSFTSLFAFSSTVIIGALGLL